jgi:amino acid transporter
MDRSQAPPGSSPGSAGGEGQEVQRLKPNAVGLGGVVFMAIATAAPITAMTGNVPVAVGYGNGTGAPAGYIVATVVLTLFAVGYVAMARYITATGAFYGYISHGLGQVVGMASGLLACLAYIVFEASLIGIFSSFAHTTFKSQLGLTVPWQVFAVFMLVLNAVLAYFDINITAKVLAFLLITEISVLTIMAISVLFSGGGPDGIPLSPLNPVNAFTGPAAGLGLFFAFWSWVGFESTAMYGEESRNPKRIIPRATLIAVTGVGVFYVFVSWMAITGNGLTQSVNIAQNDPFALFFDPTRKYVGAWAVDIFQWLIISGSFACGMAFHNCAARYLYAIGREGFINRNLGRTHPEHGSPYVASFVQTGIATTIVVLFWIAGQDPYLGLYVLMALLGTFAILIVQTLCSFAVIGYFSRHRREARHWFRTYLAPLIGGIGMAVVVVLLFLNASAAAGEAAKTLLFTLIPWIVIGVFLAGIALALYMRIKNPERYRSIGHIVYEDASERPGLDFDENGRGDHATGPAKPYTEP